LRVGEKSSCRIGEVSGKERGKAKLSTRFGCRASNEWSKDRTDLSLTKKRRGVKKNTRILPGESGGREWEGRQKDPVGNLRLVSNDKGEPQTNRNKRGTGFRIGARIRTLQ